MTRRARTMPFVCLVAGACAIAPAFEPVTKIPAEPVVGIRYSERDPIDTARINGTAVKGMRIAVELNRRANWRMLAGKAQLVWKGPVADTTLTAFLVKESYVERLAAQPMQAQQVDSSSLALEELALLDSLTTADARHADVRIVCKTTPDKRACFGVGQQYTLQVVGDDALATAAYPVRIVKRSKTAAGFIGLSLTALFIFASVL